MFVRQKYISLGLNQRVGIKFPPNLYAIICHHFFFLPQIHICFALSYTHHGVYAKGKKVFPTFPKLIENDTFS